MEVQVANFAQPDAASVFGASLKATGFAIVTQAPVDLSVMPGFYDGWAQFFASDAKYALPTYPDRPEGFFPYRTPDGRVVDQKECFYYFPDGCCPTTLREPTNQVHAMLYQAALTLLAWLDVPGLPRALEAASRGATLRVLHYPPLSETVPAGGAQSRSGLRLVPHQDQSLLTLLPASTSPGLQLLDNEGRWHDVTCDGVSLIVNAGDALQRASRGHYRSTIHRVRAPSPEDWQRDRYSTALFLY